MTSQDVIKLYENYQKQYGASAYKHISKILKEAKEIHHRDFLKHPTPKKDHEQAWKPFKLRAMLWNDLLILF